MLEGRRRRADHGEAVRAHLRIAKPALAIAIGIEAENAGDAGKAVGIGQRCRREAVIGRRRFDSSATSDTAS